MLGEVSAMCVAHLCLADEEKNDARVAMLSSALRRPKTAPLETTIPMTQMADKATRIAALARTARAKLAIFADIDLNRVMNNDREGKKIWIDSGNGEGLGFLLQMAAFGNNQEDSVDTNDLKRFDRDASQQLDSLAGSTLNNSIALMLFLTIWVSIAMLHVGQAPYTPDSGVPPLRDAAENTEAASDAATYFSPQNPAGLRWGFYVVECVFVLCGFLLSFFGVFYTIILYWSLTNNLPVLINRCEFIMDNVHIFGISIYLCLGNLILMSFSLPFILARASAVAFLCAVVVAIAMLIAHQVLYRCGLAIRLLKAQQKLAREVLRERKDARTTHGTTLMVQVMPADDV